MTENTTETYQLPAEPVVPEGGDMLNDLTAGELGTIGKLIKYDPVTAVRDVTTGLRWPALAHIAWVWAKRADPKAKLQPFLDATGVELGQLLGMDRDTDDEAELDAEANPTDSPAVS